MITRRPTTLAVSGLVATVALTGCVSSLGQATAAAAAATPPACTAVVDQTVADVARRIYAESASGVNVRGATARLEASAALARAVAHNDPKATAAALAPLLKNQVRRLEVYRGSHVLATIGHTNALAPVTGVIRSGGRMVGRFRLAVSSDASIAGEINALTGARVVMASGGRTVAHTSGATQSSGTTSIAGTAFPGGALAIRMTLPQPAAAECGATPAQTRAKTTAAIAQRLFGAESSGSDAQRVGRYVARDPQLVRAVATDNPAVLRAAIVRLFGVRTLHVVRIRATTAGGRLVNDVGGPYVLAPSSYPVRSGGRVVGTVTTSVQDDTGYVKLIHRFTGAHVQLSTPAGVVPGSDALPPGGSGQTSFTVEAYPTGPLTVTIAP